MRPFAWGYRPIPRCPLARSGARIMTSVGRDLSLRFASVARWPYKSQCSQYCRIDSIPPIVAVAIIGGSFQIPPSCHGGYSPSQFVPSLSHDALRPPNPPCNLKGQGESGSPLKGAFDCPPRPRPPPPWGACCPPCPLPPLLRCVRLVPSGAFGAWRCAPLGLCFALLPLFPLGYSLLIPLMGARARPLRRVGTTQPPPLRQARPAPPRLCKVTLGSSILLGSA